MQSIMMFIMILALAEVLIAMALAFQQDVKPAIVFLLIAGISIAAVYYVAETSGMKVDMPDWNVIIGAVS